MHRTLRELASPGNSARYPNIHINDDTLGTSYKAFSMYLKSQFVNFYRVACNLAVMFVKTLTNLHLSPHFTKHKSYMYLVDSLLLYF